MRNQKLYVITGPTASGKTAKAVALAKKCNGEILSADSRQIYKGMDIGTGKDLNEYEDIKYHLIDICEAGYKYNLYEYLRDYKVAYQQVINRGATPILCGGTGLYVESVLNGISLPEVPENRVLRDSLANKTLTELTQILESYKKLHNVTDVDTCKRAIRAIEIQEYYNKYPELKSETLPHPIKDYVLVGVDIPREDRRMRISLRLQKRIEDGMIDEVKNLLNQGISPEDLIYYGLEYKFITLYLTNHLRYDEMCEQLEIAINQFAKRQMTWFRGMERRGFKINWLPYDIPNDEFADRILNDF